MKAMLGYLYVITLLSCGTAFLQRTSITQSKLSYPNRVVKRINQQEGVTELARFGLLQSPFESPFESPLESPLESSTSLQSMVPIADVFSTSVAAATTGVNTLTGFDTSVIMAETEAWVAPVALGGDIFLCNGGTLWRNAEVARTFRRAQGFRRFSYVRVNSRVAHVGLDDGAGPAVPHGGCMGKGRTGWLTPTPPEPLARWVETPAHKAAHTEG